MGFFFFKVLFSGRAEKLGGRSWSLRLGWWFVGGRGHSDFPKCLWSSALISEFDSPRPLSCAPSAFSGLPVFVTFLETQDTGEGWGRGLRFP